MFASNQGRSLTVTQLGTQVGTVPNAVKGLPLDFLQLAEQIRGGTDHVVLAFSGPIDVG